MRWCVKRLGSFRSASIESHATGRLWFAAQVEMSVVFPYPAGPIIAVTGKWTASSRSEKVRGRPVTLRATTGGTVRACSTWISMTSSYHRLLHAAWTGSGSAMYDVSMIHDITRPAPGFGTPVQFFGNKAIIESRLVQLRQTRLSQRSSDLCSGLASQGVLICMLTVHEEWP